MILGLNLFHSERKSGTESRKKQERGYEKAGQSVRKSAKKQIFSIFPPGGTIVHHVTV